MNWQQWILPAISVLINIGIYLSQQRTQRTALEAKNATLEMRQQVLDYVDREFVRKPVHEADLRELRVEFGRR